MLDTLIKNARIIDDSGHPCPAHHAGIAGESIADASPGDVTAGEVIDASRLALSPGAIDVHDHTGLGILAHPGVSAVLMETCHQRDPAMRPGGSL